MKKDVALKSIFWLSLLGLLASLYLVQNHFAGIQSGSFCDFSESISCSLVNSSVYSELLGVPVSLFGALWFFLLALLSGKTQKKGGALFTLLLEWNVLGFLFVLYMLYAEIVLKAICPACTLVHLIIITTLGLSFLLYRQERKAVSGEVWKAAKSWVVLIIILNVVPLIFFNLPVKEQPNYDPFAQCLTDKGVQMYASFRCGVCAKTREMFGPSFQYITEVECHPQGPNSQWQLCQQKQIQGTPTWILEPQGIEIKRDTGFLSLEELQEFSGCRI